MFFFYNGIVYKRGDARGHNCQPLVQKQLKVKGIKQRAISRGGPGRGVGTVLLFLNAH